MPAWRIVAHFLHVLGQQRRQPERSGSGDRKALELDPELAEAHAASGLASALRKDFVKAQREFETAIQLDPKLYEAYYFYARTAFQRGEPDQSRGAL